MSKVDYTKYQMSDEFRIELNKINSDEQHGEWLKMFNDEHDRLLKLWETDYPNIPMNSLMLEVGKDYVGDADGEFEIKTINGDLWFIPGNCCNFGENNEE